MLCESYKDHFYGDFMSFLDLDSPWSQYVFIVYSSNLEMAVSFTGGRKSRHEGEQRMTDFSFFG